jgi:hypothetical protein
MRLNRKLRRNTMIDPKDILISNLKDTLNQLQRYMAFGLGTSLTLLVLAGTEPGRSSGDSAGIKLPGEFFPVPVSVPVAVSVIISAYWIVGWLATIVVLRANDIVSRLRDAPELLEATLTYPSIPTMKEPGARIGLAVFPALFVGIAVFISGHAPIASKVFAFIILSLPYILLTIRLWTAVGSTDKDTDLPNAVR